MGLPVPAFNGVWSAARTVDVDQVLAAADRFGTGELPWNVQLRPGYPDALDEELAGRGLVVTADIPFMVLTDLAAVPDSALPVRAMESFRDLDATLGLLEQGFGMPPEMTRGALPMRMLFAPGTTTWLLSREGKDVSTALQMIDGAHCGVFNVATPEEERGKGYGAAVTAHAVASSFAGGASCAYLQSSPLGRSVYERIGFRTVELWRQWVPAQYAEEH
jgi:hypothetical protein